MQNHPNAIAYFYVVSGRRTRHKIVKVGQGPPGLDDSKMSTLLRALIYNSPINLRINRAQKISGAATRHHEHGFPNFTGMTIQKLE